jgi:uncharacterized protein YvpB
MANVAGGTPVWIVATVDFQVPKDNDWLLWETDQGSMYVTPLVHSAVITGFDRKEKIVYVNDPYGYQNHLEVHRRNDPDWCTAGYVSHDFIE